jgi:hypothetical protein
LRLPPILAIFAGLFLAGLALFSAMALVAFSVVAGLGHLILGRLRGLWRRPADRPGDVLTVEYEVVRDRDEHDVLPEREERPTSVDVGDR